MYVCGELYTAKEEYFEDASTSLTNPSFALVLWQVFGSLESIPELQSFVTRKLNDVMIFNDIQSSDRYWAC